MNVVSLIGRLTGDPLTTELENEFVVSKFNIAIDKVMGTEKREKLMEQGKAVANFPRIVCWGKLARLTEEYLTRGKLVGIVGELTTDTYEDSDGVVRFTTVVTASEIKFL